MIAATGNSVYVELQDGLGRILAEVAAGHHVSIVQNGVVVALVQPPARPVSRSSLFGSQKGTIQMAEDFDETPAEFQEYVP